MQANKPYISTGVRHIFAIISSQISTMMEPVNAILKHEPANRRLEISPRDKFPIQSFYYPWYHRRPLREQFLLLRMPALLYLETHQL